MTPATTVKKSVSASWKDSPPMFDNPYLDYWSRVYPITGLSYFNILCKYNNKLNFLFFIVISIFLPTIIALYYFGSLILDLETSLKWWFG
jgi:hypothetical protein